MNYLTLKYDGLEKWKNEVDDRRLAYNLYKIILRAKEEHDKLGNAFCRLVISKAIKEQEKQIDEIVYRFTGLKWEGCTWEKG